MAKERGGEVSRPAQNVVFVLMLALGAWLTFESVLSAVQTYRHKGGGMVVVSASRPNPITGDMGGEERIGVDEANYKRHKYTNAGAGAFLGVVILWCAFRRPSGARSGCESPTC